MTLRHVIVVTVLYLTDCSIRVCFVSIDFWKGESKGAPVPTTRYTTRKNHVQMQNDAMFRIICLRIGYALLKFRFTAAGLVFREGSTF